MDWVSVGKEGVEVPRFWFGWCGGSRFEMPLYDDCILTGPWNLLHQDTD